MMDDNATKMRTAFEFDYSPSVLIRNPDGTYQVAGIQKEYEIFVRGWKAQAKVLYDQLNEQIEKHEQVMSVGYEVSKEPQTWAKAWSKEKIAQVVHVPVLIQASHTIRETQVAHRRTLLDIMLGRKGEPRIAGRTHFSNADIDFGSLHLVSLNKKINVLQFGDYTYYGVTPIKQVAAGANMFECTVDHVEKTKE